jgi:hypothetical protein
MVLVSFLLLFVGDGSFTARQCTNNADCNAAAAASRLLSAPNLPGAYAKLSPAAKIPSVILETFATLGFVLAVSATASPLTTPGRSSHAPVKQRASRTLSDETNATRPTAVESALPPSADR